VWLDKELSAKLRRIAAALVQSHFPVNVILVDDDYIQKLNRDFRGLDRPTDVISFSYIDDVEMVPAGESPVGEVYVSYETLEREAELKGIEVKNLFLRTGVHGLLHVVGYEHQTDGEARRMEREERRLLLDEMSPSEVDQLL